MAIRTTTTLVQGILGTNYVECTDLTPFIAIASSIVDQTVACTARRGLSLSTLDQELMERWLAAHYYTKMDPVYTSESVGRASGTYVRNPKEPEPYKDAALTLDSSGCLGSILSGKRGGVTWLGKTMSERIDWRDRQ